MRRLASVLACGAALALAGCGFTPLYGTTKGGTNVGGALNSVYVEPISDRVGYELRNNLLDLFNATGQSEGTQYRLKTTITEREDGVVLQPDAAITRYNYVLVAHYDLTAKDGVALKSGDITALASYNVAAAPYLYATVTAGEDAKNRAANEVAQRMRTELAVYFSKAAPVPAAPAAAP